MFSDNFMFLNNNVQTKTSSFSKTTSNNNSINPFSNILKEAIYGTENQNNTTNGLDENNTLAITGAGENLPDQNVLKEMLLEFGLNKFDAEQFISKNEFNINPSILDIEIITIALKFFGLSEDKINNITTNIIDEEMDFNVLLENIDNTIEDEDKSVLFVSNLIDTISTMNDDNKKGFMVFLDNLNDDTKIISNAEKNALKSFMNDFNPKMTKSESSQIDIKNIAEVLTVIFDNIKKTTHNSKVQQNTIDTSKNSSAINNFLNELKTEKKPHTIDNAIKLTSKTKKNVDFSIIKPDTNNQTEALLREIDELTELAFETETITKNNDVDSNFSELEDFVETSQNNVFVKEDARVQKKQTTNHNKKISGIDDIKAKKDIRDNNTDLADEGTNTEKNTNENVSITKTKSTPQGAKTLPNYILKQINTQMLKAINNNLSEIRFQLKPAQLGRLQLTIDSSSDALKISVLAEQKVAKEMLSDNINELKTLLSDKGINIKSIDIEMTFNFDQSMADANKHFENNKGKRSNFSSLKSSETTQEISSASNESIRIKRNADGEISFLA